MTPRRLRRDVTTSSRSTTPSAPSRRPRRAAPRYRRHPASRHRSHHQAGRAVEPKPESTTGTSTPPPHPSPEPSLLPPVSHPFRATSFALIPCLRTPLVLPCSPPTRTSPTRSSARHRRPCQERPRPHRVLAVFLIEPHGEPSSCPSLLILALLSGRWPMRPLARAVEPVLSVCRAIEPSLFL